LFIQFSFCVKTPQIRHSVRVRVKQVYVREENSFPLLFRPRGRGTSHYQGVAPLSRGCSIIKRLQEVLRPRPRGTSGEAVRDLSPSANSVRVRVEQVLLARGNFTCMGLPSACAWNKFSFRVKTPQIPHCSVFFLCFRLSPVYFLFLPQSAIAQTNSRRAELDAAEGQRREIGVLAGNRAGCRLDYFRFDSRNNKKLNVISICD
jgi:hypothetical protein